MAAIFFGMIVIKVLCRDKKMKKMDKEEPV